jgi:hypothetical protein
VPTSAFEFVLFMAYASQQFGSVLLESIQAFPFQYSAGNRHVKQVVQENYFSLPEVDQPKK